MFQTFSIPCQCVQSWAIVAPGMLRTQLELNWSFTTVSGLDGPFNVCDLATGRE